MIDIIQKGSKLLIADDDPMFCVMLRQFFEVNGYKVDTVSDGDEAVQAFGEGEYHAVILDGDMPNMDGFAACEVIRAHPAGGLLPIIIVTALEGDAAQQCAMQVQASDYVKKPINWPEFRNTLSCMLEIDLDE
ncbi:MAG: response regulator [Mariprofundaceae bacterium]